MALIRATSGSGGSGGISRVNAYIRNYNQYTTAHSETIPESDYVVAGLNNGEFLSTVVNRGDNNVEFNTGDGHGTKCYISLSSDGKTLSWTKNTGQGYLSLFAISK